ncbi:hypothetical protein MW887_003603 [Aspergillus wentii]|nr:hypothetical protein MW887_003603 [Aspergillus wentii]
MPSISQTLPVLAMMAFNGANAAMGPAFSTGPVSDDTFIREATSTLHLPKAPSGSSGDASLWVGMGTSNGDLIQSIADNWQSDDWSIYAYSLLSTGANTQMPVEGDSSSASAGDAVTMHYKFDGSTGNYTQTVLVNGKTVSTLHQRRQSPGLGQLRRVRRRQLRHSWTNTTIILDTADPNYINTMAKGEGVTGDMTTSDNGKTWTVSTIKIPEFSFGQSS